MSVKRTEQTVCEETIDRISLYLTAHDISDYAFSRKLGLHQQTYGRMARYERKLSIEVICRAGRLYGFKMIGEEWNPCPGSYRRLYLSPEGIYSRVRDNISFFKQYCKENGLSFYRFANSNPDITRDGIYHMLRGSKQRVIQLSSIITLSIMLRLPNVGAMYAPLEDFENYIKGANYDVYTKRARGAEYI